MIKGLRFLSTLIELKVNSEKTAGSCVACLDHKAINGLCQGCREDLPVNRWHCRCCALPMAFPSDTLICGECLSTPPPFSHTVAPWRYQYPVDGMIGRYKYNGQRKYVRPLVTGLAEHLSRHLETRPELRPNLIVPAPMHSKRRRQRGFNQAEDIAEQLSLTLKIPWSTTRIRRLRHTRPQRELGREARLHNLRGMFEVNGAIPARIALVDDVVTTGATARMLTAALMDAGAEDVQVWALARTLG
ncbi:ComF family protein [Marinobacter sp. NP-4(2019)]|nr:ComF family protein [Marinobacter sp. NP-4(2019)]